VRAYYMVNITEGFLYSQKETNLNLGVIFDLTYITDMKNLLLH
jgi:hypothetical protein